MATRVARDAELAAAKKNGVTLAAHPIATEAVAIFVHKDNPLPSLTVEQLRELFGDGGKASKWSDLGVDLGAAADQVTLAGHANNSGTYELFRVQALGGKDGRFKPACVGLNGSKDVIDFCARSRSALGYTRAAYATDAVRVVPVVAKGGAPAAPTAAAVRDGSYPLHQPLLLYSAGEPTPAMATFLAWLETEAARAVVTKAGYLPAK